MGVASAGTATAAAGGDGALALALLLITTAIAGTLVGKSGTFGSGGETPWTIVAFGSEEVSSPAAAAAGAAAALFLFFFLAMAGSCVKGYRRGLGKGEGRRGKKQEVEDNGAGLEWESREEVLLPEG